MSLQITSTAKQAAPKLVLCLYGVGGAGKTTLATTAPKPVFIDSEESTKALGARGIDVPVINVKTWADVGEAWGLIKNNKEYETVVIDPTGQFLEMLIESVAGGGSMDLRKWGDAKARFRKFLWTVKQSGKNVVFIAHDDKKPDDQSLMRSPKVSANLSDELVNMCDIVGYMFVNNGQRYLRIQPALKIVAKDRFDLGVEVLEGPNITKLIEQIHAKFKSPPLSREAENLRSG